MEFTYNLEFYLASNLEKNVNRNKIAYITRVDDLEGFNQLYSEYLLLNLTEHYKLYVLKDDDELWNLKISDNFIKIPNITSINRKHKLTSVSGNTGESLIIPVLKHALNKDSIQYCRITSYRKCPDFLLEFTDDLLRLWIKSKFNTKFLPDHIPLEVKSCFGTDRGFPRGALKQLISYWFNMHQHNLSSSIGVGIIARLNIEPENSTIRFYLFIPKARTVLNEFIKVFESNSSIEKMYKEINQNRKELFL